MKTAKGKKHIATEYERIARKHLILQMLNQCATTGAIVVACQEQYGMSEALVLEWIERLKTERATEFERDRPRYKAEQIARLQSDIAKMRALASPPWGAIARHEELLIRIVGTAEPIRTETTVKVQVSETILNVCANLDSEQLEAITREQMELEATARSARALMQAGAIETVGVPADMVSDTRTN